MHPLERPDLNASVLVMGILNVTPDSFSDGGLYADKDKAVRCALEMVEEGADIIDIGGESTRPGADDINADIELERVIPVIMSIRKETNAAISIDTRRANVAEEALKAGASIINDVSALNYDSALAGVCARTGATYILMHSKGTPKTMQLEPFYDDVMAEIISSLKLSINSAVSAGIAKGKIIIDPGIGFGKRVEDNLEILKRLSELKDLGLPICVGASRKSFIGKIIGAVDPMKRLGGSIACAVMAIMNGANIIRVHDVKETVQALRVTELLK